MKIILRQDVPNIGRAGDSHDVSPGYFRNYLQPRGLAVEATSGRVKVQQVRVSTVSTKESRELGQTRQFAQDLTEVTLTFPVKVGEQGRMFGSITANDIADELQKTKQVDIDRHKIILSKPLRSPGEHMVTVKLDHGVDAALKVELVPASEEAG